MTEMSGMITGVGSFAKVPSGVSSLPFSSVGFAPLSEVSLAVMGSPPSVSGLPFSSRASPLAVAEFSNALDVPVASGLIVTVNTTSKESSTLAVPPLIKLRLLSTNQLALIEGAVPEPLKF